MKWNGPVFMFHPVYSKDSFLLHPNLCLLMSEPGRIDLLPGWLTIGHQYYDGVGWVIWPVNLLQNELACVEWDVIPCYTYT